MGHFQSWEGGCFFFVSSRAQELFMSWLLAGKAAQPSQSLKWMFRSDRRHDALTPRLPSAGWHSAILGCDGDKTADIRLVAPVGATPPLHFFAWVICAPCSAFLLGSLGSKREVSLPLGKGWLRLGAAFEVAFLPWGVFIWLLFSVLEEAVTGAAKSGQGHVPGSAGLWGQSQAQETNEDAWKKYMAKS